MRRPGEEIVAEGSDTGYYCPGCSEETAHQVVARGRKLMARCLSCGVTHHVEEPAEPRPVLVRTIVSEEDVSRVCLVELEPGEVCRVGDSFVAECGQDFVGVEVTAIEKGARRVKRARGEEVSTLWTRKVEEVIVRISVHDGRTTTPVLVKLPGDEPLVVGEVYTFGRRRIRISRIKERKGGILWREGQKIEARRIKRVFSYPR
jgi:uncharacterized Zn finger protein